MRKYRCKDKVLDMEENKFTIEFFRMSENKEFEVEKFIKSLRSNNPKLWASLDARIDLLRLKGNLINNQKISKKIDTYIYELRVEQGSNAVRVLYFFYYDKRIVFTNGFIKKSQKTPRAELKKANDYRKIYLQRKGGKV